MPAETFLVAFHDGYWRVNFDGQWYGAYPNRTAAQRVTVVIAQAGDYLPTRVVVRDVDGTEEVVWDRTSRPLMFPGGTAMFALENWPGIRDPISLMIHQHGTTGVRPCAKSMSASLS